MDERREEREELAQIARDDAGDRRETAAEHDYWTMQDEALSWPEFVSMEAWRG